jgi:hypothetical protein
MMDRQVSKQERDWIVKLLAQCGAYVTGSVRRQPAVAIVAIPFGKDVMTHGE